MGQGWNDLSEVQRFDADPLLKSERAKGENLIVIDALNFAFRWKHSKYTLSKGEKNMDVEMLERPESFAEDYRNAVLSLAGSYSAKEIVLAADKGKSRFRLEIDPLYKSNRDYSHQTDAENQMFLWFIEDYEEALQLTLEDSNILLLRYKGVEADDIAAYICDQPEIREKFDNIWLVSSDKDWDLLVDEKVSRFNWATQKGWKTIDGSRRRPKEITIDNWSDHHLGDRHQYLAYRVLEGDTSDGIAGVPQVGPARSKALINKYGSMQGLLDALPIPGKAVYIQNVNAAKEQLERNARLMDLSLYEEALGEEHMEDIKWKVISLA